MESTGSVWPITLAALIAGVLIGVLAYRLLDRSNREIKRIKDELDSTRSELSDYRARVNQHFDKSSELMDSLSQNYVRVYQHLASGAKALGDSKHFSNLLQQPGKIAFTSTDTSDKQKEPKEDTEELESKVVAESLSPKETAESFIDENNQISNEEPISSELPTAAADPAVLDPEENEVLLAVDVGKQADNITAPFEQDDAATPETRVH